MKKNAIIAVLVLLLIILTANIFKGWITLSKNDRIVKEYVKGKTDTLYLERWHNAKDSTVHITFKENKSEVLENKISPKTSPYVSDTLAPALKIATEKINELTRANFVLEGKLKASKIQKEKDRVYYESKYLQIVSNVKDSTIDYKYNAIVDIVNYNKKKWLLGAEDTYIDISSPDKNMRINGVEHFKKRVDVKPKKWGLGIQAGYYYVPGANQFYPGFGVGVSYNLIRL